MSALDRMSKAELKDLLLRGWMTHDGMWFFSVLSESGPEQASRLNLAAIRAMVPFEMERLKRALGVESIRTYEELQDFVENAFELIGGEFMRFTRSYPGDGVVRWDAEPGQCFAYKGVKRIGVIDQYQCGIFPRVEGWLTALGLEFEHSPKIEGCMMHTQGKCYHEFRVKFSS